MQTSRGLLFERQIFGTSASQKYQYGEFEETETDFSSDLTPIVEGAETQYPDMFAGRCLYFAVVRELRRLGIDPTDLKFIPLTDTIADRVYFTDALFYLPALYPHVVTIDAFHVPKIDDLRDQWIRLFDGSVYSESNFQSDIFRFKRGFNKWLKAGRDKTDDEKIEDIGLSGDLRQLTNCKRPENHFILTPGHVATREKRRAFAKLVAGYFAKVAGHASAEDTA